MGFLFTTAVGHIILIIICVVVFAFSLRSIIRGRREKKRQQEATK